MRSGKMTIPYRDLRVKEPLKERLLEAVSTVLDHGRLIQGPEVEQFEQRMAAAVGREHAVGVASGTGALELALHCLGIGPGDEVITTPLSWVATTSAIARMGAQPVFVDVGEDQNMNPALVEQAITSRTRAILPVHFTGKLCAIEEIIAIAEKHGLPVVEDAAQSYGARSNGKMACSFGRLSTLSLNPMKILAGFGESGMVFTDDAELAEQLRILRYAGTRQGLDCLEPSSNYRMDTLQAAMLLVVLDDVEDRLKARQRIARQYTSLLQGVVECPQADGEQHSFYTYVIRADRRDELAEYLLQHGVETKVHHPLLIPRQQAYKGLPCPALPVAERLVGEILSLPNQEDLAPEQVEYVAECIRGFYAGTDGENGRGRK